MDEDANQKKQDREHDKRDAQGVADAIHAVLMAGGILGDPPLVGAVAEHGQDDTTAAGSLHDSSGLRFGELTWRAALAGQPRAAVPTLGLERVERLVAA